MTLWARICIIIGTGLLIFGYNTSPFYAWDRTGAEEMALGAMFIIGGLMARRTKEPD